MALFIRSTAKQPCDLVLISISKYKYLNLYLWSYVWSASWYVLNHICFCPHSIVETLTLSSSVINLGSKTAFYILQKLHFSSYLKSFYISRYFTPCVNFVFICYAERHFDSSFYMYLTLPSNLWFSRVSPSALVTPLPSPSSPCLPIPWLYTSSSKLSNTIKVWSKPTDTYFTRLYISFNELGTWLKVSPNEVTCWDSELNLNRYRSPFSSCSFHDISCSISKIMSIWININITIRILSLMYVSPHIMILENTSSAISKVIRLL